MKKYNSIFVKSYKALMMIIITSIMANTAVAAGFWQDIQDRGKLRCAAPLYPPLIIKDPKTK